MQPVKPVHFFDNIPAAKRDSAVERCQGISLAQRNCIKEPRFCAALRGNGIDLVAPDIYFLLLGIPCPAVKRLRTDIEGLDLDLHSSCDALWQFKEQLKVGLHHRTPLLARGCNAFRKKMGVHLLIGSPIFADLLRRKTTIANSGL